MLEIREYSDFSDPALVAAWDEFDRARGSLFTTRLWVDTWLSHFGSGLSVAARVGHDDGRAVGLAPLLAEPGGRLVLPVNFLSPRGEFVCDAGEARGFVRALLAHSRAARRALLLLGVPERSPTLEGLAGEAREAGYLAHLCPARVSPFIDIDGSWDAYLTDKPRKVTHEWERKMRKLERAGDVRVLRFEQGMDVRKLVDDFIAVEKDSWKEKAGTSIGARGVSSFYHELSAALASAGSFEPFWLELDGRVVAFLYGVVHGGTYYAMKTSYIEGTSSLSPGVRLFHEAVSHAFGAGLARFDFLGERARWKDQWANAWLEHTHVHLRPNTAGGTVAHLVDSRLKPLVRRARRAGRES